MNEMARAAAAAVAIAALGLTLMVVAVAMVWLPAAVFIAGGGLTVFGAAALRGLRPARGRRQRPTE